MPSATKRYKREETDSGQAAPAEERAGLGQEQRGDQDEQRCKGDVGDHAHDLGVLLDRVGREAPDHETEDEGKTWPIKTVLVTAPTSTAQVRPRISLTTSNEIGTLRIEISPSATNKLKVKCGCRRTWSPSSG